MTLRPAPLLSTIVLCLLPLSACGDDPASPAATGSSPADQPAASSASDVTGMLGTGAKQVARQIKASSYGLDGATLTFTFDNDPAADGSTTPQSTALGHCQIARTVFDAVAPGEIDRLQMAYPSTTIDCAEYS